MTAISLALCERRKYWRTALLTRTVTPYMSHRLCLSYTGRMADERSENRIAYWRGEQFVMDSYKSGWTVRALFSWSANLYREPRQIALFGDTRYALMLPVATSACGQG